MKYTITIRRRIRPNVYDSLLVFISESFKEYNAAFNSFVRTFKRNKTIICKYISYDHDVENACIEYEF